MILEKYFLGHGDPPAGGECPCRRAERPYDVVTVVSGRYKTRFSCKRKEMLSMTVTEKIIEHVKALPEAVRTEVLDFVEYLESKMGRDKSQDGAEWSTFSISQAMRGMEREESPYSAEDLKEAFS